MTTNAEIMSSANQLLAEHAALILRVRTSQQQHRLELRSLQSPPSELLDLPLISSSPPSPVDQDSPPSSPINNTHIRADLPPAKRARVTRYKNYVPEEETIRNDYSQRYVDSGDWPQNSVLGADPEHRFEEYPKQQRLLTLKKASVNNHSVAPSYLPFSDLQTLHPAKFDVILLDPPFSSSFTWEHLQELPIPSLAADPSFVFLWVGSGAGEGLESGREVLAKWGYRRCEDVVWVKTNKTSNRGPGTDPPTSSLLTRTKQHCLIGIRGTVRRSNDSWFVHCNVDTDVIFWEGDATDPTRKPPEMYTLIENFCLGTRRLEIFGRTPSSLRRGWVTALSPGQESRLPTEGTIYTDEGAVAGPWNQVAWDADIKTLANGGKFVVPMTSEIDALRPKSPVRSGSHSAASGGGGGQLNGGRFKYQNGNQGQGQTMMMPQPQPMMMGIPAMAMAMGGDGGMLQQWPGAMTAIGPMGAMMGQAGYGFGGGGWGQAQYMGDQYAMDGGWDEVNQMADGMNMGRGGMMGPQQWGNAGGGY
ncbi:MT-A70-domain-containing protein [Mycena amicta]|nr:MT-A70-domain-containing protein [Mycena amicta]